MEDTSHRAIAIVGVSAILPDAPNAQQFWDNIKNRHYSISEVPPERWDIASYYDPDPRAPDKTYCKIGGWVRDWQWDPYQWHLPIPPKVALSMDDSQKWAVAGAHALLLDYGDDERPLDRERTAVVLGNAMGGELHYMTSLRIFFPEYASALSEAPSFLALPGEVQRGIEQQMYERVAGKLPLSTEDTMPGELSNCMAGRVANLFDFKGPNFVCDAA
jgi:acyl transferase domain-containing protein